MSDELLEKLGGEFTFYGMRALFGITFAEFLTQPNQYLQALRRVV